MHNFFKSIFSFFRPCEHTFGDAKSYEGMIVKECTKCKLIDIISDPYVDKINLSLLNAKKGLRNTLKKFHGDKWIEYANAKYSYLELDKLEP